MYFFMLKKILVLSTKTTGFSSKKKFPSGIRLLHDEMFRFHKKLKQTVLTKKKIFLTSKGKLAFHGSEAEF